MVLVQKKQTIPVAFSKKDNNNYWSSMKWTVTQSWSRPEICIDWAWANQTITLRVWQYKSCVNVSDLDITWSWLSCADLTTCPVIVQIQWDINDIEWDITSIQTDITNLQNATSIEAMQDAISSLFVHWNHTNITASYDDVNNQIILVWSWWGGGWFTCADVSLCISWNVGTQTALLNWLQALPSVTLVWDWNFQWDVVFDNNTVTFDNATINIDTSVINSNDSTYNHINDTINYDSNTDINWWNFNNNTFNNPTFTWLWATVKKWPITWTPAWSSLVIVDASSIATSVVNWDNITSWTPNWNYFVYDMSTPWQITVTSKDFLWNNVSENWIVFYYTITY